MSYYVCESLPRDVLQLFLIADFKRKWKHHIIDTCFITYASWWLFTHCSTYTDNATLAAWCPTNGIVLEGNLLFMVWCAVLHVMWSHEVYELCDMECGDGVFITPYFCCMWDITHSSFGSEGGYPKLSFSPLFHRESILILLQISHGLCLSLPLQLSSSSTFRRMFPVSGPWMWQLCRAESLHPLEHHVTPVPTDKIKDTWVDCVSERTCLNKQKQKICVSFDYLRESSWVPLCLFVSHQAYVCFLVHLVRLSELC